MAQSETVTLAGGCFWCIEAVFKRLKGVISVASGYAASDVANPSYQQVCSGRTGATEAIQVTYDPTTLNRQGNDVGTQYRSGIYYTSEEQKRLAEASKAALEQSHVYKNPVVTEIVPFTNFYVAEDYHQDYYDNNRYQPYCKLVIDPKVRKLLKEYSNEVKEVGAR
jgi:peptide-methionine (S)-S-oxide reductase